MKGATEFQAHALLVLDVSIHAPVKGATGVPSRLATNHPTSFNSRSREGSDIIQAGRIVDTFSVSIHAPVKGATGSPSTIRAIQLCFNSRSREGSDLSLPLGGSGIPCFNSRSREGSDLPQGRREPSGGVSIHAPVKGAT